MFYTKNCKCFCSLLKQALSSVGRACPFLLREHQEVPLTSCFPSGSTAFWVTRGVCKSELHNTHCSFSETAGLGRPRVETNLHIFTVLGESGLIPTLGN